MTRNDSPDFSRQLEMNFAGIRPENAFKEHLDRAEFSVLLELRIPGRDSKLESVVSKYSEFESIVSSRKTFPGGLAFLEDSPDFPSLDPGEFAAALCKNGRDRHLIYVNGRDRRPEDIDYNLGIYRFEGFKNIAAVSGTPSATLERLNRDSGLRAIEDDLRSNPHISVLHNLDDPILSPSDREFLDNALKKKLTWFDCGGHMGNLALKEYQQILLRQLQ